MTKTTNHDVDNDHRNNGAVVAKKDDEAKQRDDGMPSILQFWLTLYRSTPKMCRIPFTDIDGSFTLVSCAFLLLVHRLILCMLIAKHWNPTSKMTRDVAASSTSILHSLLLVPTLAVLLWNCRYSPSARMESSPRWWQDVASSQLSLCTGYMLYDMIGILRDAFLNNTNNTGGAPLDLSNADLMFIGHHVATMLYMTSTRVIGAGHMSAMMLMFVGEFTNPFQNLHNISRFAIQLDHVSPHWIACHPYIEYAYAVCYSFFRVIVGPICILHITYDLSCTKQGRTNIPWYVSYGLWLPMIWGVLLGSISWAQEAVSMAMDGIETVKYDKNWDYGPRYSL